MEEFHVARVLEGADATPIFPTPRRCSLYALRWRVLHVQLDASRAMAPHVTKPPLRVASFADTHLEQIKPSGSLDVFTDRGTANPARARSNTTVDPVPVPGDGVRDSSQFSHARIIDKFDSCAAPFVFNAREKVHEVL